MTGDADLDAWIARQLETAPPLTDEQADVLLRIFRPTPVTGDASAPAA